MIQFSDKMIAKINSAYEKAVTLFGECKEEVVEKVNGLEGTEQLLAKYLYGNMPLSDVGAYSFEVLSSYAKHGAFLLETSPFLEGVSEEYFLQYVVAHRINSEDITDCRRFFYDMVFDRVKDCKTRAEAVLEANNWCYEQATYRATSARTASPMTVYRGGFGRCGEESTFLTTILRSVGIPARQVYAPRWSHSDDNHAWVEIWCDNEWKYTGACEPKPVLNNGWFPYAASRALVLHTRLFDSVDATTQEVTDQDGCAVLLNESERYAHTTRLYIKVKKPDGTPIANAKVRLEIVNSAEMFPIATLKTDDNGCCNILMGLGDVQVQVLYEGKTKTIFADLRTTKEIEFVMDGVEELPQDEWVAYHINAPESAVISSVELTEEQEAYQLAKNEKGDVIRNGRQESYYDKAYVEQWKDYKSITHVLNESKGNFAEIRKFLDTEYEGIGAKEKDMLLSRIALKDCRDITVSVLEDALSAFEYRNDYAEDIFVPFVLAQGVFIELSTPYRKVLKERFAFMADEIKANPMSVWNWITENITYYPEKEYTTIFTVPEAVLKIGSATPESQAILFVSVLRTFGIPARMDRMYGEPQYYKDRAFHYVRAEFEDKGTLKLVAKGAKKPGYYQQFTVGKRQADGHYETIHAWGVEFNGDVLELELSVGEYRVLTCDRMSSGNIVGKQLIVTINKGEIKEFELNCDELKPEDFMDRKPIPTFVVADENGIEVASDDICGTDRGLLFFADPGKEPTEHVFNELLEMSNMSGFPACTMNLILKNKDGLEDPTLVKVRGIYPDMKIWYADFNTVLPELEKNIGVTTKNLPYVCVTNGAKESLYCCSGYNVGCVDVFARLIRG